MGRQERDLSAYYLVLREFAVGAWPVLGILRVHTEIIDRSSMGFSGKEKPPQQELARA
jgi:hypothetical protein